MGARGVSQAAAGDTRAMHWRYHARFDSLLEPIR